ncbi:hypothetical protein MNEG_0756, partial [Monoraphidium neglectum]
MEEPRGVKWRDTYGVGDGSSASAPPSSAPSALRRGSAIDADADWFTHDMHVPSSVRLNHLFEAGGSNASSSGWSELDLEVERLAQ